MFNYNYMLEEEEDMMPGFIIWQKTAQNKNRGETCDAVVKTPVSIYKEFLSCKTSIREENRVGRAHEGPTRHHGAP